MVWICCRCRTLNDSQYICRECGALNESDYVCVECGALNDPDYICKKCGHDRCENCRTLDDYRMVEESQRDFDEFTIQMVDEEDLS